MERGFTTYNYFYERKVRQYDNQPGVNAKRIIANEIVGQSYLAVNIKKPSDASRRKYKVWGEYYNLIFSGKVVEPYVIAVQIYRYVASWLRNSPFSKDVNDIRRKVANQGGFHIARMSSYLWRHGDDWNVSPKDLQKQIVTLETNPHVLDSHINEALIMLEKLIQGNNQYFGDLDSALKSGMLDSDIDKILYTQKPMSIARRKGQTK